MLSRLKSAIGGSLVLAASIEGALADPMVIGSGGVTGLYFPVAGAIAGAPSYPADASDPGLVVESTGGSLENLIRLRQGDLDFAIVRSDLHYDAVFALGPFSGAQPFAELRSVAALHAEPLVVIARADAGIGGLADLAGHSINLGPEGTPTRALLELVLGTQGWEPAATANAQTIGHREQIEALCDGDVDVIAFISGFPSGTVHDALTRCETVLVPIAGSEIDRLLADHPALLATTIPALTFPAVDQDIVTMGPIATLVTTAEVPDEVVAAIVSSLGNDLDWLRTQHPALRHADVSWFSRGGLTAPYHRGAAESLNQPIGDRADVPAQTTSAELR